MNGLRLLMRTTAFRTSMLYAVLYSVLAAGGLGFIYWSTGSYIGEQIDARLRLEMEVLLKLHQDRAMPALIEAIRQRSREESDRQRIFFYRVVSPRLRLPPEWPESLGDGRGFATLRLNEVFPFDSGGEDPVRVLMARLPDGFRLLVGRDLNDERELLAHTLNAVLAVTVIILLLALSGGIFMGLSSLRRIAGIDATAGQIIAGDLTRRVPLGARNDEFDALGRKLNAMLDRIEALMAAMREVTDNVAHDLRSPLNRLRNRLDVTLLEARSESEYRGVLEKAIDDVDGLLRTFNALLGIAQAEAGIAPNDWREVDLGRLVEDLGDLYDAVAEDRQLSLHCEAQALKVAGNRQLLTQAVGNLLDNAVKYTPAGGRIDLSVEAIAGGGVRITVADNGPGIPETQRERVLERFVRLDSARSLPGNGLGLSLVRAVASLHRACLALADNHPGLRASLDFSQSVTGMEGVHQGVDRVRDKLAS